MKALLLVLTLLMLPTLALAHQKSLEERVTELEQQNAELYHELEGKKTAGLASQLTDKITLSGLLEVEGSLQADEYANGNSESTSDLTLATAQLGLGIKGNDNISGNLLLLYEEGENNDHVSIDEATINIEYGALSGRFGKQYVPFGNFYSHFISDPLTLELGEAQETAALLSYQQEHWSVTGFVFNGDIDKTGDEDQLGDYGFSVTVTPLENLVFGASYLSDLSDTDAELVPSYGDRVGGYSAYFVAFFYDIKLSGEVLGALEDYRASELDSDGDGQGDQPLSWNVEIATDLNDDIELAARLAGSQEFAEMPELQYGACVSWKPLNQLSLSLEYLHGEFDEGFAPTDAAASPLDYRDLVTTRIAFEF